MAFQTKKPIKPVEVQEEEEYDEEDLDEEESEEEQIKKAVSDEELKRQKVSQEPKVTVNDILFNHEDRIKSIEATLFRLSRI